MPRPATYLPPLLAVLGLVLFVILNSQVSSSRSPDAAPEGREAASDTPREPRGGPDWVIEPRPEPIPNAVPWREDFDVALQEAEATDRLVFLYLYWPTATCPACHLLERLVFSREEMAGIEEDFVPVRVENAVTAPPRVHEIVHVFDIRWAPALFVLSADGDVVLKDFGSLLPPMTVRGLPMAGTEDQYPRAERLLSILAGAREADEAQRARLAQLRQAPRPWSAEHVLALGRALEARGRPDEALEIYEQKRQREAVPAVGTEQARLLAGLQRNEAALEVLEELIRRFPDDERQLAWRLQRFALEPVAVDQDDPHHIETRRQELRGVLRQAREAGDAEAEGRARLALARLQAATDDIEAARRHLTWFEEGGVGVAWPPEVLLQLALLASAVEQHLVATDYLQAILRRHPDSVEAETVKHGMLDGMRRRVTGEPDSAEEG